jgi:hypothetical protein
MSEKEFTKHDTGKPGFDFVAEFDTELGGVNSVLTFGAGKYGKDNWKKADEAGVRRCKSAAIRHILASLRGEHFDPETGYPHLYHALCGILFSAWHERALYRGDFKSTGGNSPDRADASGRCSCTGSCGCSGGVLDDRLPQPIPADPAGFDVIGDDPTRG